jgi:hypothetical protein
LERVEEGKRKEKRSVRRGAGALHDVVGGNRDRVAGPKRVIQEGVSTPLQ